MSLDPKTQILYQILGSAGLGTNIGNLPHPGNVQPASNHGSGGRRQIGCLQYEWFPSKNNPGIPPKDPSTLGEVYYALPGGNGQYCPNKYGPDTYPCPAFPCWDGPAFDPTLGPTPHGTIPNHDEFSVRRGNSTAGGSTAGNSTADSSTAGNSTSSSGAANANAPS